jgi:hypothetical protein
MARVMARIRVRVRVKVRVGVKVRVPMRVGVISRGEREREHLATIFLRPAIPIFSENDLDSLRIRVGCRVRV